MKFGYVCTNYNNSQFSIDAVRSVVAGRHEFLTVVVDNQSRPEEVAKLAEFAASRDDVHVLLNPENSGYFRGLNLGLRRIRQLRPDLDVIVTGNNDLVFPLDFADSVECCRELLARYPVIAPNIVTLDGVHQNPHVIARTTPMREMMYDLYFSNYHLARFMRWTARLMGSLAARGDEAQHRVGQPIYQGHGSCYLLTRLFFEHFTELWAPTFLMGEEFFLSKQLSDGGFQAWYEPSIVVQHHCHVAVGALPSRRFWEISKEAHKIYRKHVKIFGQR
jgi:GT2 family glycosyltransferase